MQQTNDTLLPLNTTLCSFCLTPMQENALLVKNISYEKLFFFCVFFCFFFSFNLFNNF